MEYGTLLIGFGLFFIGCMVGVYWSFSIKTSVDASYVDNVGAFVFSVEEKNGIFYAYDILGNFLLQGSEVTKLVSDVEQKYKGFPNYVTLFEKQA